MTQDKIIEVLNLAINSLKNTARMLKTHNDLYINAIQGCYAVLNEVSKLTPSQSEPVGELILDPMFLPTMKVPLVDWKINLTSLDIGTNFYTKPQPTSQEYCCIDSWENAKAKAWNNRDFKLCKCDHNESCGHCYHSDFKDGGKWDLCKPMKESK